MRLKVIEWFIIEKFPELFLFFLFIPALTSVIGQRLHEMILNPPMKIYGLLPHVSSSSPPCPLKGWVAILAIKHQKEL